MDSNSVLVVLVEDDAIVAATFVDALEEAGYQVLHAVTGAEAIELLDKRTAEISALVTDIKLGAGPDGWEIAHHARRILPNLPVVYATGDSVEVWAANGVPNSIVLPKPFALGQLITAVSQLITAAGSDIA